MNADIPTATIDAAAGQRVERHVDVAMDHPAFAGHFPGRPILPGVSLLAEVLEVVRGDAALLALVGEEPRLAVVKFIAPVLPGAALVVALTRGRAGLDFEVHEGQRLAASGRIAFARSAGP